jgi:SAM-dependent methyltransferase
MRKDAQVSADVVAYWDSQAATFDREADHGLGDPGVRAAWAQLLDRVLPSSYRRIADLGCGTGSLAVLLAADGRQVSGVDSSPVMLGQARAKAAAAGVVLDLHAGDAAAPDLTTAAYDAVLARHVVWALPDPGRALAAWVRLLRPGGRLVLVEGFWSTGSGLHADDLRALVEAVPGLIRLEVEPLADPELWGGPIEDERYVLPADFGCEGDRG